MPCIFHKGDGEIFYTINKMSVDNIVIVPEASFNYKRRKYAHAAETSFFILVLVTSIMFFVFFAMQPKYLQLYGPDNRPVGKMSTTKVVLASIVTALLVTVFLMWIIGTIKA